jgi:hypothetical protein
MWREQDRQTDRQQCIVKGHCETETKKPPSCLPQWGWSRLALGVEMLRRRKRTNEMKRIGVGTGQDRTDDLLYCTFGKELPQKKGER